MEGAHGCARLEVTLGEFAALKAQYTSASDSLQHVDAHTAQVLVDATTWIMERLDEQMRVVACTCADREVDALAEQVRRCHSIFERLREWASRYGPVKRVVRRLRRGLAYASAVVGELAAFLHRYKFGIAYTFLAGYAAYRAYLAHQSASTSPLHLLLHMNVKDVGVYSVLSTLFDSLCPLLKDDALLVAVGGLYVIASVQDAYYRVRRDDLNAAAEHDSVRQWAQSRGLDASTLADIDQAFWHAADRMVVYRGSSARKGVGELDIILHGLRALFSNPRVSLAIFLELVPGVSVAWRVLVHITCTASYTLNHQDDVVHAAWSILQRALSHSVAGWGPPYTSIRLTNDTPAELLRPATLLIDGKWHEYTEVRAPSESVQTLLGVMSSGALVKWVALGASAVLVLVAIDKLRLDDLQLDLQSEARDAPESERLERAIGAMVRMVGNLPRYAGSAPVRWASQFRAAHLRPPPHRADCDTKK